MVTVTVVTASLKYLGGPVRTVLMMIVTPVLLDERLRIRYYQINTLHQQQKNRILLYCANTCCICCRSEICTTYEETWDKRRVKKDGLNGQILFKLTCKFNSMKHCILAVFITTAACFAFALDQQRDSSNSKRCQKKSVSCSGPSIVGDEPESFQGNYKKRKRSICCKNMQYSRYIERTIES